MNLGYQIPMFFQWLLPLVTWRRRDSKVEGKGVVYLTFDDGPVPEVTPKVLEILREEGVPATFFMVGENAQRYPELVDQVRYGGHKIGNHTFHHLKGWSRGTLSYLEDVEKCDMLLGGTRLFRPPYGRVRINQILGLKRRGYTVFLWDVLTHDYSPMMSTETMVRVVKEYTRDGSIIVFHDSVKSGERMLKALPEIIHWLKDEGYTLRSL